MDAETVVGIILIVILAIYLIWKDNEKKRNQLIAALAKLQDFNTTQKYFGQDGGIAIDERRNLICIIVRNIAGIDLHVIDYKDILSSAIFENGDPVTQAKRSSQVGGLLIGGVMLGSVGNNRVKKIDLQLIVNDTERPVHFVNFLAGGAKTDSFKYQEAMRRVRHWHALMDILIKKADAKDEKPKSVPAPAIPAVTFVADELKKLAELRDANVLTDVEFNEQKQKLLATSSRIS